MRFYIDQFGCGELEIESDKHVIADFLSSDLQGSKYNMNLFLEDCRAVANREVQEREATGNAHSVTIKYDGVTIENVYTDDEVSISSIAEFEWYLKQWERLITTGEEFTIESPFK